MHSKTARIKVQKSSYKWFLKEGLKELFDEVSPIRDFIGRDLELYFLNYYLDEPRFDEWTAKEKNVTFEAALRVDTKLVNKKTGEIKEQEIYFGTIPLMTLKGTFIINGTERVVVSQLHRSSGVFFNHDQGKNYASGKIIYSARIIPVRGSWIDMEIDTKDIIYIRIDRRRKFPVSTLFKAFGYTNEDILDYFYFKEEITKKSKSYFKVVPLQLA